MIKEEIREILDENKDSPEDAVDFLEELFMEKDCESLQEIEKLIQMILPDNIMWSEFGDDLDRIMGKINFETLCKVQRAVGIFILKVLIEMKIKSGKEIDCSI